MLFQQLIDVIQTTILRNLTLLPLFNIVERSTEIKKSCWMYLHQAC